MFFRWVNEKTYSKYFNSFSYYRQYFIAIPDMTAVGVIDGKRLDGWCAIIRAVNTTDAMSATIEEIPYDVLHKITKRITSEVKGISRVLMDLTPKPVGTIEWE